MPGIVTHYLFAHDALERLGDVVAQTESERRAFALGSQGPDPVLFASMRVANPSLYTLGTEMHNRNTAELLSAFTRDWHVLPAGWRPLGRSYALGFVCHYLLDSTVHPLVYAQQHACCKVEGIKGLDENCLGEAHAAIETSIDEMLMVRRMGEEAASFDIARSCLPCDPAVLSTVSSMYGRIIPKVFGRKVPREFFTSCVNGYRRVEIAVDAARRTGAIPAFAPNGYFHLLPFFRQLGHANPPNAETAFTNDDHLPWEFPFEPARTITASFDELYAEALDRACGLMPQLAGGELTLEGARALTKGLNFKGATRI